jgi:hypothetical protein
VTAARGATLALDLGTATGWALLTADGQVVSGTHSFKPGRYEGGGMRFLRFRAWLNELQANAGTIGACYFEEVRRHAGVDAAHVYGGLMATLTAWCEGLNIAYAGVPVGTIKKHATGKGNADKVAVIAAAQARGFTPADDNEADALALLNLVGGGQDLSFFWQCGERLRRLLGAPKKGCAMTSARRAHRTDDLRPRQCDGLKHSCPQVFGPPE